MVAPPSSEFAISLLCEKLSERIDQNAAVVWHKNPLAELR